MDLKGKFSNTLQYEGYVDIVVRDGDLVRKSISKHNAGTINLCNYIRDALLCVESTVDAPRSIIACRRSGDVLVNLFNIGYPYSNRLKGESVVEDITGKELGSKAVYKFIIPWTYLSTGAQVGGFRLMDSNKSPKVMAEIFLDNDIDITPNTNLEVTWTLVVKYV